MCAIAGIIGKNLNKINKLVDVQTHRGPDDKKTSVEMLLKKLPFEKVARDSVKQLRRIL